MRPTELVRKKRNCLDARVLSRARLQRIHRRGGCEWESHQTWGVEQVVGKFTKNAALAALHEAGLSVINPSSDDEAVRRLTSGSHGDYSRLGMRGPVETNRDLVVRRDAQCVYQS